MKYLIVTADDLGLTKSIDEGIAKAYKEGVVTSISVLPTGEAYEDAVRLARDLKLKDLGAHLSLTETAPSCDAGLIPTLVTKSKRFPRHYGEFILKLFFNLIDRKEIYVELRDQLEKVKKIGVKISNLSGHEHIHMIPAILEIFVALAKEYNIPAIRFPHKDSSMRGLGLGNFYRSAILSYFGPRVQAVLDKSGIIYADNFSGFLYSGNITETALAAMVSSLEEGVTELVCHPGFLGPEVLDRYTFHKNCESELYALTSPKVKKLIKSKDIKLVTYGEFLLQKCA